MDVTKFEELQLDDRIIRAITEMGFEEASPIQAQAIPVVLEGRDMIGQAQTGTGKTAAFGLPLLQKVPWPTMPLRWRTSPPSAAA